MDSATPHPVDMKLSNVKVVFFPANTTLKMQSSDQGIIKRFTLAYRKFFLLAYFIAEIDSPENCYKLTKSVSLFHAVHWISTLLTLYLKIV